MKHTFLLVHARWHGAWCWDRVTDLLRRDGHDVLVPDRLDFAGLTALLEAQDRPVTLVGHSSSGMTVSALAELVPDRVHLLAYATAFLLPCGGTPREVIGADTESILTDHLVTDERTGLVSVRAPEKVFFGACTPADAARASARLVPEPAGPPDLPAVALTAERFGRVPRVYLECLADRALGPSAQRRMHTAAPCRAVYRLPADHAPFLSTPVPMAEALIDAT